MLGWSVHQCASTWTAPASSCHCISKNSALLLRGDAGLARRVGRHQRGDDARRLLAHARDRLDDLGVGGVAEQRAPGVAVLLDERQERVDAAAQALLPRRAGLGVGLQAPEDLARVLLDELGVELALAGEVLVDQRLRDARGLRDLVERGAVVAAAAEDLARGVEQLAAARLARRSSRSRGRVRHRRAHPRR